ncbi:MAG: protease HtpX [Nitrospinae bacterium RIFCSPLOWO2_02_FULL_39_110]|nr:MAG: protease HtpX [Nitrospinae bacterium RIFCSPHIGHO2_02_39_11]OGV99197.1 MAG: protease HtpX [Nitrospinae bacterium RIFCSPHIGHO2_12_FULL_39_42]OGW00857.1 MAG: protease HtpX [Nitrospinae bacterium RIFCSPHIGHO2_02_FULL_39_82]OGW01485.1 MAG: protease HtpX [Nitrospinae bacterium RIFCSPLOWO2_02_39_17]OGW05097.1 MAG: protease HtpX [Nitrospinae bacterium RIFCSPLOWO2_02_FULL_39_110]OGW09449.1 MAG: protease HtpX [Nitrospinae bacterium RIFCSPLOWO2_12_39_15]OGW10448.1 MAG: protease HtpX [Nitrospinae
MNTMKTVLLMTGLTLLLVLAGSAFGGKNGMVMAFAFACIMNIGTYWFSDKIVLAMYRARKVSEAEAPELHRIVRELSIRAGVPMPKVYTIDNNTPNAFATGRNPEHAAVAVTTGIMNLLERDELSGVLGHELAHIKHRDILIGTIAATVAGAISMLANMAQWTMMFGGRRDEREGGHPLMAMVMMIFAPIAAMLIQMAISRSREYLADEGGAKISGNPLSLARALGKLQRGVQIMPMNANPATAHMFIVNPLTGGGLLALFSTHPPIEERVRRLEKMLRH